ncbi:putative aBC transporter/periplasmic Mn/Zn-binding protein [Chlamydia psittaci 84-8471/1]|nr:putative aBC transporter/periplasmic Mn/Zn-binding protein [Chlamydia psittaci 84-8471/1]
MPTTYPSFSEDYFQKFNKVRTMKGIRYIKCRKKSRYLFRIIRRINKRNNEKKSEKRFFSSYEGFIKEIKYVS